MKSQTQRCDAVAAAYKKEIARFPRLSSEEEVELAKLIEQGDKAAREKMINCNLYLVVIMASKYENSYLEFMDLVMEGNIGLMKAVDKFDYRLGNRFSTYASWWIKESILLAIGESGRMLSTPKYINEIISKMVKFEKKWVEEKGTQPTEAEIANGLNITVEKVQDCKMVRMTAASFDAAVGEDGDATLGDFIESVDLEPVDDLMREEDLLETFKKALKTLPEREAVILQKRSGLYGYKQETLDEIGKEMGLSKERVRQLEEAAKLKIKKCSMAENLKGHLAA